MGKLALSTEAVVEGAIALVDREGAGALSMRRLAAELGSSTMGLYRYVEDRDALMEAIAEQVTAGFELPEPSRDWRSVAVLMTHRYRDMVQDHPRVFGLLLRHQTAAMGRLFSDMAAVLRQCGLEPGEARHVLVALSRFLLGWCLGEATTSLGSRSAEDRLFARSVAALVGGLDPA